MSNKALLVAQREYYENLRTKTFWIGILAVPVMIVLMVFVPRLLEKAKDVRRYAVIDESGWLLDAIEERATYDDTWRLLTFLQDEAHEGQAALERLPAALRPLATMVEDASAEELEVLARRMSAAGASFLSEGLRGAAELPAGVSEEDLAEQSTEFLALTNPLENPQRLAHTFRGEIDCHRFGVFVGRMSEVGTTQDGRGGGMRN